MKNVMKYKEFLGTVNFDSKDNVFYGKVEGINSLVTFEGKSVDELILAFETSVDDYIKLCESQNKPPLKSCKGSFNVRIKPALHRKLLEQSTIKGISLNQLVEDILEKGI
jgi:predicted HicB family RNase H-like nuclease